MMASGFLLRRGFFVSRRTRERKNSPFSHRPQCTLFTPPSLNSTHQKKCITVVFDSSWDDCNTYETKREKKCLCKVLVRGRGGGWQTSRVMVYVKMVNESARGTTSSSEPLLFFSYCYYIASIEYPGGVL